MRFEQAPIPGVFLASSEPRGDERGFFARVFCAQEFAEAGLATEIAQVNNSFSARKGTLRGMHYQLPPDEEVKIVRCIAGALWDVVLDLRPGSRTFGQWFGAELTAENRRLMVVPKGFAHGFITLTDNTEMLYFVSTPYSPARERGVRWDDPRFGIRWPAEPTVISDRDRTQRDFDPAWHLPA